MEPLGMADVAKRSSFLIEDGAKVVESWLLGAELPDIDTVIEAAARGSG